jgi:hypothetical protein
MPQPLRYHVPVRNIMQKYKDSWCTYRAVLPGLLEYRLSSFISIFVIVGARMTYADKIFGARWLWSEHSHLRWSGNISTGFSFLWWGETESTSHVDHHLAYCTSPGWWMRIIVEHSVEWLARETEVLRKNLPQCHFIHQKSHITWPGLEPGQPR